MRATERPFLATALYFSNVFSVRIFAHGSQFLGGGEQRIERLERGLRPAATLSLQSIQNAGISNTGEIHFMDCGGKAKRRHRFLLQAH